MLCCVGPNPITRLNASTSIARELYHKPASTKINITYKYRAAKIRRDFIYLLQHRTLPVDGRGRHISNPSRIFDEAFQGKCRQAINNLEIKIKNKQWSVAQFHASLMNILHEDGTLSPNEKICSLTACFICGIWAWI